MKNEFIFMSVEIHPTDTIKEQITLKHNNKKYEVKIHSFANASNYFARRYGKSRSKELIIKDMHSDKAFDAFIKLVSGEKTKITPNIIDEVRSIIREWDCQKLSEDFDQNVYEKLQATKDINVKIGTLIYKISIPKNATMDDIKESIFNRTGIQVNNKFFLYCGSDLSKLDLNIIQNNDKIIVADSPVTMIKIFIIETTGKHHTIFIYPYTTVYELKKIISPLTKIVPSRCKIVSNRRILEDNSTLHSLGVTTDSQLTAISVSE